MLYQYAIENSFSTKSKGFIEARSPYDAYLMLRNQVGTTSSIYCYHILINNTHYTYT